MYRLTLSDSKMEQIFNLMRWASFVALALMLDVNVSLAQISASPALRRPATNTGALPTLGDGLDLSASTERRIGDRIAASVYRDPDYVDDPVLGDYVQTIWAPLLAAARARGELNNELDERFAWEFFLVKDRTVNAFALPGGYFGIHLGLIGVVASRDELAAVLGHELSHVTQRHISRLMTQQSKQTPWMIAAMVLGALAASKSPDAANAAIVGSQAAAAQSQLNFSRDMEREADRVGFGVMTDAGFDSRGVASMFEKLQQAARLNDNVSFPYLRSHPLTTQRIAESQARVQLAAQNAQGLAKADELESSKARLLHAMMSARARVVADPGTDALHTMVSEAQRLAGAGSAQPASVLTAAQARDAGAFYGGALAAAKLQEFGTARNWVGRLKVLSADDPTAQAVVDLLQLEIDMLGGRMPAAAQIDIGKSTLRSEVLIQSKALMAAGKAPQVSDRLQTWVRTHPRDALAWQLLSMAYGMQSQNVRAIRADAESRVAQLDYTAALDRLRSAQNMMRSNPAGADFIEASIIDTRARQVDSMVKEQAIQDKLDR